MICTSIDRWTCPSCGHTEAPQVPIDAIPAAIRAAQETHCCRAPRRVQRRRTKGWRMPEGAIYVGRPSRWGNDFPVGQPVEMSIGGAPSVFVVFDRQQAVNLYENWQVTPALRAAAAAELAGRDLACWCPLDQPCHADVLLELANR